LPEHRWSVPGTAYSAREWLDNHHAIKSRLRTELVAKLPIYPGDHVVDLGCATGNWTLLLADRVGIRGKVVGIDTNAESLALAEQRRSTHILGKVMSFTQARLEEVDLAPASVDAVLLFNVLSYFRKPEGILQKVLSALRPGGRLFIKDSDLMADFFWPVPFDVYAKAMSFVAANPNALIEGNYDPFFSRRIPALLASFTGIRVTAFSQSFSFLHPLSPEEREYVLVNAFMIRSLAEENGGGDAARTWYGLFDGTTGQSVLDDPNFIFSMNDFIFQAVFS
jgi:ubiquinone/menaquinone biosynthesis C-methylase UbiE